MDSDAYLSREECERLEDARSALKRLEELELEWKPTPLWRRLFREALCEGGECRDIVERHVLPKLNQTDVKFLYDVNSETRALIKRSSREGELEKAFRVREMSSISTLEFAWEHRSMWPSKWDETDFAYQVARTNILELLKWAREVKKCKWDQCTIIEAARSGHLEMLKYCVANNCRTDPYACECAAQNGHLECLKHLHEEAKAPWDWRVASEAAKNNHLHILEYLVHRKYDKFDSTFPCRYAAKYGHLDCLKYLREVAEAPWDCEAVRFARERDRRECLHYLLENGCPLPDGWRYERGELFAPAVRRNLDELPLL
jgi:hypothetical protein